MEILRPLGARRGPNQGKHLGRGCEARLRRTGAACGFLLPSSRWSLLAIVLAVCVFALLLSSAQREDGDTRDHGREGTKAKRYGEAEAVDDDDDEACL